MAAIAHDELARRLVAGERPALARALRLVDDRPQQAQAVLRGAFAHAGRAHVIGVTGNPGAGKSTLTDHLIRHYRQAGERVAVLAIDPSSPFTGGAILGDRIRMSSHAEDDGVFIRSLATRGVLGGLSASTYNSLVLLDAAGYQRILVETVGVGQDEVDVARTAHTTLVLAVPGLGDEIQSIKAGLLEVADVFVLNKADRPGAQQVANDLHVMLTMLPAVATWRPPIVKTVASRGEGLAELGAAIAEHQDFLRRDLAGRARLADNQRRVFAGVLEAALVDRGRARIGAARLAAAAARAGAPGADPYALVAELLAGWE